MYLLRLLVLPLLILVSIPLVAQARRLSGNICFPPEEEVHYLLSESPFPRPVPLQQLPSQDGINLAHMKLKDIVAPPEFRVRSEVTVDASGVSLFPVPHYALYWCTWSLQQRRVRY